MDDTDKLDYIYRASIDMHSDLRELKAAVHGTVERPGSGLIARVERVERYLNYIFGGLGLVSAVGATIAWLHDLWRPGMKG